MTAEHTSPVGLRIEPESPRVSGGTRLRGGRSHRTAGRFISAGSGVEAAAPSTGSAAAAAVAPSVAGLEGAAAAARGAAAAPAVAAAAAAAPDAAVMAEIVGSETAIVPQPLHKAKNVEMPKDCHGNSPPIIPFLIFYLPGVLTAPPLVAEAP